MPEQGLVATCTRCRGRAHVRADAAALRRRPFLFRGPAFKITKLQKVSTKLKFSENKSCRGDIDLQLSQRASYVLINRFVGKSC
jgi:5-methylcytosine-specific restriction endonuclease McrA